jgi:hypothetical protein
MSDYISFYVRTNEECDALIAKITDKNLDLALDLDRVASKRIVLAEYQNPASEKSSEAPEPTPTPKPAPAKPVKIRVTLLNASKEEIKVQYQHHATAESSRNINIPAGGSYDVDSVIGGQIYWRQRPGEKKSLGSRLALTMTEAMHNTKVLIAK